MLQQRSANDPLRPGIQLPVCHDLESAYEHFCDHVLTWPEAHFWAHLIPCYRDHLDHEDENALFSYARRLWLESLQGQVVPGEQELFDGYVEVIRMALKQCVTNGWFWEQEKSEEERRRHSWHGLGKCGVYVIWHIGHVGTAMLLPF